MGWCWGLGEMSGGGPPKCCPGSRMLGSWRLGPDLQEGEEREGWRGEANALCNLDLGINALLGARGRGLGMGHGAGDPSTGLGRHRRSRHKEPRRGETFPKHPGKEQTC